MRGQGQGQGQDGTHLDEASPAGGGQRGLGPRWHGARVVLVRHVAPGVVLEQVRALHAHK